MEEVPTEVTIRNLPRFVIIYIIVSKFYNFGVGMRSEILLMYMSNYMGMSERDVKIYYHSFDLYSIPFFPLGAWMADCYFGYWNQFIYVELALLPLTLLLPISSLPIKGMPVFELVVAHFVTNTMMVGFTAIVVPLIGDQFVLPQQSDLYTRYLMVNYWLANIVYAIGIIVGPLVRSMSCFGFKECYIVPIMICWFCYNTYVIALAACWKIVKKIPPNGKNVFADVVKIIIYAIKKKTRSEERKDHWLDYAADKYEEKFINETKRLSMLYLLFPMLFIYTLSFQESTAFLFQARRMNGDVGIFTILPDQMYAANTILCIIFIPLFEYVIFPFLNKHHVLTRRVHRVWLGGSFYAISFAYAGTLSLAIESRMRQAPASGEGQLRIYNNMNCDLSMKVDDGNWEGDSKIHVSSMNFTEILNIKVSGEQAVKYSFSCGNDNKSNLTLNLLEGKIIAYHWGGVEGNRVVESFMDEHRMHEKGLPLVRTLCNTKSVVNYAYKINNIVDINSTSDAEEIQYSLYARDYTLFLEGTEALKVSFKVGSDYVVLVNDESGKLQAKLLTTFHYKSFNILLMLPQYLLDVIGEILYSIAWAEFFYVEAPTSMKATVGSLNQIIASTGSVLVAVVETSFIFDKMSINFYTYSVIMALSLVVFAVMIYFYKESGAINKRGEYVQQSDNKE